jgi:hypothetical protein
MKKEYVILIAGAALGLIAIAVAVSANLPPGGGGGEKPPEGTEAEITEIRVNGS